MNTQEIISAQHYDAGNLLLFSMKSNNFHYIFEVNIVLYSPIFLAVTLL